MIPRVAHFIWLGPRLPWVAGLAVHSTLQNGEMDRVVLHHEVGVDLGDWGRVLRGDARFELRPLSPEVTLGGLHPWGPELLALHGELASPAARANVLRLAILASEGGIYLDTDTVTLRSLGPLTDAGFFCGTEPVAFPSGSVSARHPLQLTRGILLHGVRAALARVDGGHLGFRSVEPFFDLAANNAVLGGASGHPFILGLLDAITRLPERERHVRFALGTHLLQRALHQARMPDLVVHPPGVFYPLGPEISRRWFRRSRHASLESFVKPNTRVVHWYASVSVRGTVDAMDAAFVRAHAGSIPFCRLALPLLAA